MPTDTWKAGTADGVRECERFHGQSSSRLCQPPPVHIAGSTALRARPTNMACNDFGTVTKARWWLEDALCSGTVSSAPVPRQLRHCGRHLRPGQHQAIPLGKHVSVPGCTDGIFRRRLSCSQHQRYASPSWSAATSLSSALSHSPASSICCCSASRRLARPCMYR